MSRDTSRDIAPDAVVEAVRHDLFVRCEMGVAKYGMTLADNPANLRERLQHAYEEVLDQANYLKWAIMWLDRFPVVSDLLTDMNLALMKLEQQQDEVLHRVRKISATQS